MSSRPPSPLTSFRARPLLGLLSALCLACQPHPSGDPSPLASDSPSAVSSSSPVPSPPSAQEPVFTVEVGSQSRSFPRSQLLTHPALVSLTLPDQAAFGRQTVTVKAVPVTALFEGLAVDASMTIEFDSLDGFSASLDPKLLLNQDQNRAIALLAIEQPEQPWPPLAKGGSAGPFYLVWRNPQRSQVGQEQWPYQLRSFKIQAPVEQRFPALLPDQGLSEQDPVWLGYHSFVKNCLACHTLNGEGTGRLGPDLNEPHSPTEYMHEEYLRKLVRDPQSLRHWKGSRMSSFSERSLPETELDQIVVYLKHKAAQRRANPRPAPGV